MKKKNALVFLLGPITPTGRFGTSPVWELVSNLRQFFTAEAALINEGVAVVNPANDIFALLIGMDRFSEKMAKEKSLDKLSHCDVALALPGWERSEGAKAEKEKADELKIPVFYSLTLLLEYLKVDDIMGQISEIVSSAQKAVRDIIPSNQELGIGEAICGNEQERAWPESRKEG